MGASSWGGGTPPQRPRRRASDRQLAAILAAADATTPAAARIARDPVQFPRAYRDPADIEVAAVLAAMYAYGRVDLFLPVVARILAVADAHGGPAAFVDAPDPRGLAALTGVTYRWNTPADLRMLLALLRAARARHGSLGALFPAERPAAESLGEAIDALRTLAPPDAPRSFRTWLPHPREGSACKRWLMLLRWMVRRDDVDLGAWPHLHPRDLVIPLDTHVGRIARLLGLTTRPNADWAAAEQVTARLRALDPDDPVRWDFALAHLGISGGCRGHHDPQVCPGCPVVTACAAGRTRRGALRGAAGPPPQEPAG
ncbi:MAG: hypothetical protein RLZZ299_4 [Pseudomonadota bacterium]